MIDLYDEVTKVVFDEAVELAEQVEKIRCSSPMRKNYYKGKEMIAYEYDSYGSEYPATFFIKANK